MTKTTKKPAATPITAEAFAAAKLAADAATKAAQTKRAAPMAIKIETMKSNIVEPPKPAEPVVAKSATKPDPRKAKASPKGIPNAPHEIDIDGPDPRPASLKREEPKAEVVEAPKAKKAKPAKAPTLKPDKGALALFVEAIEAQHGAGHAGLTTSEAEATAALVARYKIEAGAPGNGKHYLVKRTQAGNWYWGPLYGKYAPEELPPTGWKREDDYADAKVAKKAKRAAKAVKREAKKAAPKKERSGKTRVEEAVQMLQRQNGASINELCERFGWQAHSARAFVSATLGKKLGHKIESEPNDKRGRVYRIA